MPLHVARVLTAASVFCLVAVALATVITAVRMIYLGARDPFVVHRDEKTNNSLSHRTANTVTETSTQTTTTTTTVATDVAMRYMAESSRDWFDVHGVPPKCDAGYRLIEYKDNSDILVDGRRTDEAAGLYCVRSNVSVIQCNAATSRTVDAGTVDREGRRQWFCAPLWPDVFGGRDGGDIVVCGGSVLDKWSGLVYAGRLPPSANMKTVESDPRTEQITVSDGGGGVTSVYRWWCAEDIKTRDYMGNRYLESPSDRLARTRNECAEYIYQAVSQIAPTVGRPGFCDCLANGAHGPTSEHRRGRAGTTVTDDTAAAAAATPSLVSVPHACSPCVAGGGLDDDDAYTVRLARGCAKSYTRRVSVPDGDSKTLFLERFPCGTKTFDARNASCTSGVAYVGVGLSEYGRRLVGLKTLSSR